MVNHRNTQIRPIQPEPVFLKVVLNTFVQEQQVDSGQQTLLTGSSSTDNCSEACTGNDIVKSSCYTVVVRGRSNDRRDRLAKPATTHRHGTSVNTSAGKSSFCYMPQGGNDGNKQTQNNEWPYPDMCQHYHGGIRYSMLPTYGP